MDFRVFFRNVGHLMKSNVIKDMDNNEVQEGIMDMVLTSCQTFSFRKWKISNLFRGFNLYYKTENARFQRSGIC
jgi:hypothetical protein